MISTRRPYTFKVTTATSRELAQRNKRLGLSSAAAYEPTHSALQRIESQGSANPDRLRSWVTHPDERVVMRLLRRRCFSEQLASNDLLDLVHRAIKDAKRRRVLWTPLLDTVNAKLRAGSDLWAFQSYAGCALRQIGDWLAEREMPSDASELLAFESHDVWTMVAERATAIDVPTVRALTRRGLGLTLAQNPCLDAAAGELLLETAYRGVTARQLGRVSMLRENVEVLRHATIRHFATLSVRRLTVIVRRMSSLKRDLMRPRFGGGLRGENAYGMLRETVLTTARRRMRELTEFPEDLECFFRCADDEVRLAALELLGSGGSSDDDVYVL